MTAASSSRLSRFQHGVDDSPTRSPNAAMDIVLSVCRAASNALSILSSSIMLMKACFEE